MTSFIPFLPSNVIVPPPFRTISRPVFQDINLATGFPGWDPRLGGTVIVFGQYSSGLPPASNNTLFQIYGSGTLDVIGLRLGTDATTAAQIRSNGSIIWASPLNQTLAADIWANNEPHAAALSWTPTTAFAWGTGQYEENNALSAMPLNLATFSIGRRNGMSDPMPATSWISKILVFRESLTRAQVAAAIQRETDIVTVLAAGQSNASNRIVNTADANGELGFRKLKNELPVNLIRPMFYINGATGGSSIFKVSNPSNFWLDEDTGAYGTALQNCLNKMAEFGGNIDYIIWDQGEADCGTIGRNIRTIAQYETQLMTIYNIFRSRQPNVKIHISPIGRRAVANFNNLGTQEIRELQMRLAARNSFITLGATKFDLSMSDQVHLDNTGYETASLRDGFAIRRDIGQDTPEYPVITGATRSTVTVTVTIRHSKGTDFTPTTAIEGFFYLANGATQALTNAIRTTNGSQTVTIAHTAHGLVAGARVTFNTPVTYNGVTLSGIYQVLTVPTADTYTLGVGNPATATDGTGGGGAIAPVYQNVVAISAAVRTNATTITLTLASGVAGTLYYAYGEMLSVNPANLVKDNSANTMPLRSYVQVVT